MAKYEVLVYSKDGLPMGNIFSLCRNFKWSKTRNEAESVSFDLDLADYEQYIEAIGFGADPLEFMEVGRNDIRIKRNGVWLLGTNIIKFGYASDDPGVKLEVAATGYLNYYKRRYANIAYTNTPQEDILWGVIDACNQVNGGDYGIRRGTHRGGTVLRQRNQVRKEVKSFFQQMAQVIGGPDFEFTADKLLNTFEAIGVYRKDLRLVYPGNIASFNFGRSVEKVSNFIYGIGSGNGEDAVQAESEDASSEDYLYRREQIITYNSVVEESTLQENIDAVKHYAADPIELPTVTVEDGVLDLSVVGIGDTLPLEMHGSKSLAHINGNYRIESIDCSVDENGSETTDLTFDNIDINAIISMQDVGGSGDAN